MRCYVELALVLCLFGGLSLSKSQECSGPVEVISSANLTLSSSAGDECCLSNEKALYCQSFDAALGNLRAFLQGNKTVDNVQVLLNATDKTSPFVIGDFYELTGVKNLSIRGVAGSAHASCTDETSALRFWGTERLLLENLHLDNCSNQGQSPAAAVSCFNCITVNVRHCNFTRNRVSGLLLHFNANMAVTVLYEIDHCNFNSNGQGNYEGGGMNVMINDFNVSSRLRFAVTNSNFYNNEALNGGGVVSHLRGENIDQMNITFSKCNFSGNNASNCGGGAYTFASPGASLTIKECLFSKNIAENGAAFHALSRDIYYITLESASFMNNTLMPPPFGRISLGVVYFLSANVSSEAENVFASNQGTALGLDFSTLLVQKNSSIIFNDNHGTRGGALFLFQISSVMISAGAHLNFSHNHAVYGGAIFQNTGGRSSEPCIFAPESRGIVHFENNTASTDGGNSIYFQQPSEECFHQLMNYTSFTRGLSLTNCLDVRSDAVIVPNNIDVTLSLGQTISFNVTVMDRFPNTTCETEATATMDIEEDSEYKLGVTTVFVLKSGGVSTSTYLIGPKVNSSSNNSSSKTNVVIQINILHSSKSIPVNVHLNPCSPGFVYQESQQYCVCSSEIYSELQPYIICDRTMDTAYIRQEFWAGVVSNITVVSRCYNGYCSNIFRNCTPCPICGSSNRPYCQLHSDQCEGHRSGTVCGDCEPGFSSTYGAIQCTKKSTCSGAKGAIPWLITLVFLILDVVLLVVLLKFGSRIKTAYLFCFVYYYSIVKYLIPSYKVHMALRIFLSILESITQLNPIFLGYVPICFSDLSPILHLPFQYLNPILIGATVLILVFVIQYLPCGVKFSDNTPTRAITVLMLLSFTALAETSFHILNPVQFSPVDTVYVSMDPSVEYFGSSNHVWWFIVAILVEVLVVNPFILLLFLSPLLRRYVNLNRIKPILDEFHGYYKDKYQWMAGLYFLCRQVYIIVLFLPFATKFSVTTWALQIITITVAFLHVLLQPYKDQWLNNVDLVFLFDLVLVSVFYGPTTDDVFLSHPDVREAIVFILIIIPVLYIILASFGGSKLAGKAINVLRKHSKSDSKYLPVSSSSSGFSQSITNVYVRNRYRPSIYREPLLGILDAGETPVNDSNENLSHNVIPSTSTNEGGVVDSAWEGTTGPQEGSAAPNGDIPLNESGDEDSHTRSFTSSTV